MGKEMSGRLPLVHEHYGAFTLWGQALNRARIWCGEWKGKPRIPVVAGVDFWVGGFLAESKGNRNLAGIGLEGEEDLTRKKKEWLGAIRAFSFGGESSRLATLART
jgi:hypothetical protein